MASPSTVITLGFGTFGSVNLLPTLGYGSSGVVEVPPADQPSLDFSGKSRRPSFWAPRSRLPSFSTGSRRVSFTARDT